MNLVRDSEYALDLSVQSGRIVRHRVSFPWSLGRAYVADDWMGGLRVIPQVAGAGLLAGDRVRQRVRLRTQTKLRLESAGAMQVLAGNDGLAASQWHFDVGPGAMLVLDAEPYALMPKAALGLRSLFRLAPGAVVLAAEMVCHIRPEAGQLGSWQTETRVHTTAGAPCFIERQVASCRSFQRCMLLPDKAAAFGTIWVLADQNIADHSTANLPDVPCRIAKSMLRAGSGVSLRLAAKDGGTLREAVQKLIQDLEPKLAEHHAASSRNALSMVAQT